MHQACRSAQAPGPGAAPFVITAEAHTHEVASSPRLPQHWINIAEERGIVITITITTTSTSTSRCIINKTNQHKPTPQTVPALPAISTMPRRLDPCRAVPCLVS
ncbi:hypothetical protein P171DRAFT_131817 [Karstenula rhodostoma CBS 690.94]|uniref:Uncharacterized protein n=1 Tax=Karstenula rhodostoma CBS 690.94 TaxID=1392251 RepID=A0A9P4P9T4_9PLEO|nr:hypothetical protein P171DRAFT_131817 [Karstenula rhodostoma CBS 690.94]